MAFSADVIHALMIAPNDGGLADSLIETLIPALVEMRAECDSVGLEATRDLVGHAVQTWERSHSKNVLKNQCFAIAQELDRELKRRVCFILPRSSQDTYEHPLNQWERVLDVFHDAREDVEEMNRCLAFGRHAAAVFHVLLAVECGVVELGKFIGVTDRKPGWDATCQKMERVLADGRKNAPRKIKKHFQFLELVNKDMQSMKMAWRNKVNHAAGRLVVMTSDFKPTVAEKIISACHGFMLLMATEGPLAKK